MKQNVFIALAVISTLVAGYALFSHRGSQNDTSDLRVIYNQWKVVNNIKFSSSEDDYRFGVFAANFELILKHNTNPRATSSLSLNKFAHLTADEFSALHFGLNYNKPLLSAASKTLKTSIEKIEGIPDEWDWEKQGKVTPVVDQGQCGSSHAFPAIGAVETLHAINTGKLTQLSVQQIMDCAGAAYQSIGCCCGGLPAGVFEYVRDNGVVSEADYPYIAKDGACNIPAGAARVKINSYLNVTANSEEALRAAVYKNPVASGVDGAGIQFYQSGILGTDRCSSDLSHGVLIVGYGTEGNTPYWKVKNSWGADWGEKGYFRIERLEGKGACGINEMDNYPTN